MKLSILSSYNKTEHSIDINNQNIIFKKDNVFYVKSFWNKKTGKYEQKTIYWTILWPSEVNGEVIFKPEKGSQYSIKIDTLIQNNLQKKPELNNVFMDNIREFDSLKSKLVKTNNLSLYRKIAATLIIGLLSYKQNWSALILPDKAYQEKMKRQLFDNIFDESVALSYKIQLADYIKTELESFNSPLTYDMISTASQKYNVDVNMLMAFMRNDSQYGTKWVAVGTKNPGNVWNIDDIGKWHYCKSWEEWVNICAAHLAKVSAVYEKKFGKKPTAQEIAHWIAADWTKFYGVYMTAENGPQAIKTASETLLKKWIKWIPNAS